MRWFRRDREDGLPRGLDERFTAVLGAASSGQVPHREVVAYVASGQPASVVPRLAGTTHGYGYHLAPEPLQRLYAELGSVEPEVWVRWGRVLESLLGNNTWNTPLAAAGVVPGWLEHLLSTLAQGYLPRVYPAPPPQQVPVRFADVAAVAAAGGVAEVDLLDGLLTAHQHMRYTSETMRQAVAGMPGFPDALVAHLDRLSGRLTSGPVDQRVLFCSMLRWFPHDLLAAVAPHLAVAATATATKVREAALPLLLTVLPAGSEALRGLAVDGKPDVRMQALELLHRHGGPGDGDWARETAAADRAERVRALAEGWTRGDGRPAIEEVPPELDVPLPPPTQWRVELTPELRRVLDETSQVHAHALDEHNRQRAREAASYQTRTGQPVPSYFQPLPADPDLGLDLAGALESGRAPKARSGAPAPWLIGSTVQFLASRPEVGAVAMVTVLARLGLALGPRDTLHPVAVQALETVHARTGAPDLLTLQRMLDDLGLAGAEVVWRAVTTAYHPLATDWPDEHVWPFLAHNIDHVTTHTRPDADFGSDDAFYRLVGSLPVQPPVLVDHLFSVALGLGKSHRTAAQDALAHHPDRTARAAAALTDGKAEIRSVAALWLARIADPASLPALEAAVAKEKHDVAQGSQLDALTALGRPVEAYLDRDRLAADADKAVAKGLPKDLDWLGWERLPALHWSDSGAVVPLPVVQHLVAQAVRAKSAEPNAVLRKYAGLLVESDRRAFGHALLEAWLAQDLTPISPAEAQQRAHQEATALHRWMQQSPASFQGDPLLGKSVAELTAHVLPVLLRTPAGSATASKGLLAVVAATGGREVVPPTERYLKEWYGQRSSQGKALIGMLAWVPHPAATQLLLAIGSRFRTKSFQVEATRQVEALAEREGWTVAELADRTVPTAGFDAEGRLELSYGARSFTARLLPDLTVELRTAEDAVIKSLPAARQSDDADEVKAAKAAYSGAKKELKALGSLQQRRLYEALCTERTWSPTDWQRFLAGHPVMRLLCQRLVWVAEPVTGERTTFRLLDDGTLSDADDDEVTLPDDGVVRLAHDTNLSADEVEAWLGHLADYEVQPLFQQLGKGLHALPEGQRAAHQLEDFRGHTLEAFALRNRALRLGWTRGQAEDGGWFHAYLKRFPTLGLLARLGFTGNGLPEENRTVGLLDLSFQREAPAGAAYAQAVPLGEVPAVLLSETWHDVRSIAAEGGGFDPDWERTTSF